MLKRVLVSIMKRDLEHLSDCDDTVRELLERAQIVEISFAPDDLDWVRQTLSPENNGWGMRGETERDEPPRDVKLNEMSFTDPEWGDSLQINLQHGRGL